MNIFTSHNPAGGMTYHLRALLNKHRWQPYCQWLSQKLTDWKPTAKNLVLVGPSAGWTLPKNFLHQFESVIAYDIDPWSKLLFRYNHRHPRITWRVEDFLGADGGRLSLQVNNVSTHAFLFCNVLGQTGVVYKKLWKRNHEIESRFVVSLKLFLNETREWASFHDVYSTEHNRLAMPEGQQFQSVYQFAASTGLDGNYVDHLTGRYFSREHETLHFWPLSSSKAHLIGWQNSV